VRRGVAVEKLSSRKSAEIRSRQEALRTIFPPRLDFFYHPKLRLSSKRRVFQQPLDFSTSIRTENVPTRPSNVVSDCATNRKLAWRGYLITDVCISSGEMARNCRHVGCRPKAMFAYLHTIPPIANHVRIRSRRRAANSESFGGSGVTSVQWRKLFFFTCSSAPPLTALKERDYHGYILYFFRSARTHHADIP
jgi:hypothetical protein